MTGMKGEMIQYRQGDVLIEGIKVLPNRKRTTERLLVRGEGRNHGHFATGSVEIFEANQNEIDEQGGFVSHYLNVTGKAAIEHLLIDAKVWTEEHDKIYIPPGSYRILRQREYNPYKQSIRILKD